MICTNCGKEQEGNPEYCQNCGAKLDQGTIAHPGIITAIAVNYAGFWKRFGAWVIDTILLAVGIQLIAYIVGLAMDVDSSSTDIDWTYMTVSQIIGIIVGWLYFALMESSSNQATLGKMVLKIIVTDEAGNRISFARATGRSFAKYISSLILLIGYFMIGFTKKKQGLHDIIAKTLVVVK